MSNSIQEMITSMKIRSHSIMNHHLLTSFSIQWVCGCLRSYVRLVSRHGVYHCLITISSAVCSHKSVCQYVARACSVCLNRAAIKHVYYSER